MSGVREKERGGERRGLVRFYDHGPLRTCLNIFPESLHAVWIVNSVLKMLHNLAPYQFLPPVTFFSSSS